MNNDQEVVINRSMKSINIEIKGLTKSQCIEMIESLNEKTFFNRKLYCRGIIELITPGKNVAVQSTNNDENESQNESDVSIDKIANIINNPAISIIPVKSNVSTATPKPTVPKPDILASETFQQVAKKVDKTVKTSKESLRKLKELKKVSEPTKSAKWNSNLNYLKTSNNFAPLSTEDDDNSEEDDAASQCSLFSNYDNGTNTTKKRPLGSPELRDHERRVRNKSNAD